METKVDSDPVLIVGAGIIGVCCAAYLLRAGRRVLIIDRLPPGESASFGNAGSLSPSSCVPIAVPGLLAEVPRWLLDRDGPLHIRWSHLPRLLPWLVRFVRAGQRGDLEATCRAMAALHAPVVELYEGLARAAGVPELVRRTGLLHLYTSERALEDALALDIRLRARHGGARYEVLNGAELRALEPDLDKRYVRAVLIHDQGYAANPGRLVKAIAAHVAAHGGEVLQDEVRDFEVRNGRVEAVRTASTRRLPVGTLVIAAGAWSHRLLERLGVKVPLAAERGYHVSVADAGIGLRHTVAETDAKFVATPMETGIRFAGTVELAGVDAPPDYRRADAILRAAKRMFPDLRSGPVSRWMGCRPSLPDGLPIIGRSPRQRNVLLAFGHAHTGMCGGPGTGRMIAAMVQGAPLNIDPAPYRVERFRT